MPERSRDVAPGPSATQVRTAAGEVLDVPRGWALLAPGDATLTRRVKQAGPSWSVKEKRGRKQFSRGVWAPAATIATIKAELEVERAKPEYGRRLAADRARRAKHEAAYADTFELAVRSFLAFAPRYRELEARVAAAIAAHAVPVGSGTVARTKRIPVERRAEAATIAWLRHQTTGYDSLQIPRVKGMRREVRRLLAQRSRELLTRYRRGEAIEAGRCLLERALLERAVADAPALDDDLDDDDDDDDLGLI